MEKAKVNMTNWELYVYEGRYNLSGIADHHPTLGKGAYVRYTSPLVNYSFDEDVLVYETKNTIYSCPLKYMLTKPYFNVIPEYKEQLVHCADHSDSALDKIIAATAKISLELNTPEDTLVSRIKELQAIGHKEMEEMIAKENERLTQIAKQYEDCVYLEVSYIQGGDKLAYHLGEYSGTVDADFHGGMFQDSILYMKYGTQEAPEDSLDFRYFPRGFGGAMETYSWSDNIKQAVIKNICDYTIRFNGTEIAPGELKIFTPENHTQGLVSPDCYNGKSVFSHLFEEVNKPEE